MLVKMSHFYNLGRVDEISVLQDSLDLFAKLKLVSFTVCCV